MPIIDAAPVPSVSAPALRVTRLADPHPYPTTPDFVLDILRGVPRPGPAAIEPIGPDPEDAAWWAAACDHEGWARDGELSPDEQEIELATLDRYNAALEAMYGEAGVPCW